MITDGTYICAFCGEALVGCSLCGEAPLLDMREKIRQQEEDERAAEHELWQQEKAIRDAAAARGGFHTTKRRGR